MIEIIDVYDDLANCDLIGVEYTHGPYIIHVFNDYQWIIFGEGFIRCSDEEYEAYLRMSLEIYKLYKGEEL